jgi:hypothetical protein
MSRTILSFSAITLLTSLWAVFPSPSRAAELDEWCATATKPSSIVICADPELRRMAVARTRLFADGQQNLTPDAYKLLLDDQWRWIKSYTAACGVVSDGPAPALPIAQPVIECYKRAARERISYLTTNLHREVPGYRAPVAAATSPYDAELEGRKASELRLDLG